MSSSLSAHIDFRANATSVVNIPGGGATSVPLCRYASPGKSNLRPGNKQSGGRRLSGVTTQGNPGRRALLREIAWAIAYTADNDLAEQFHRLARRRGKQKTVVAIAHSLLAILYHMLRHHRPYTDLGPDYFERLDTERLQRHPVRRLEQLGYTVTLTPVSAA